MSAEEALEYGVIDQVITRKQDVTEGNRKWLASAAVQQGGHREPFLVEMGHHLDAQPLSNKAELAQTLSDLAQDPTHSLDEAVEIAEGNEDINYYVRFHVFH